MLTGVYWDLYTLLKNVIGGTQGLSEYMEYSIHLMCTVVCTLLVFLPFYVVYRVVRMICG